MVENKREFDSSLNKMQSVLRDVEEIRGYEVVVCVCVDGGLVESSPYFPSPFFTL